MSLQQLNQFWLDPYQQIGKAKDAVFDLERWYRFAKQRLYWTQQLMSAILSWHSLDEDCAYFVLHAPVSQLAY